MYADPVEGLNSSFAKANFSLNHALCAVQINIKNDSYTQGPGNISRIAVSSAELATAASLNSMTGELSAFSGKGGEIVDTNAFTIGKEAHATTVMAVPTGGQGELSIKITLDGKNHRVRIPVKEPFVKGKRYILDILAKDKMAPLEVVSVDVKPWIDENLGDYPMEVGPYGPDDYAIEVTVKDGEAFFHNVRGFTGSINWGDGTEITTYENVNNPTHTYAKAGKYKVIATGIVQTLKPSTRDGELSQITDILYIGEEIGKGITSMERAFPYAKITKIRPYIFENCTQVTNFDNTFEGCSALTAIPQGLFDKCTQVTSFRYTFDGCSALTAIPQGLFDHCSKVTDFYRTFQGCSSLTTIPVGLFDKCTQVTDFRNTFSGCSALAEIPVGLFDNCPNVTDFTYTFAGCSNIRAIPQGLFDNCTAVTRFVGTFSKCQITTIPTGLFDNCTKVTDFESTFNECKSLTEIPQGLFDNCTNVTKFEDTFYGCSRLAAIPVGLFDNCTQVTDFWYTFSGCWALRGESPYTLINGQKVHLYERSNYPEHFAAPTYNENCFLRCTGLSDYNKIPATWGGVKK